MSLWRRTPSRMSRRRCASDATRTSARRSRSASSRIAARCSSATSRCGRSRTFSRARPRRRIDGGLPRRRARQPALRPPVVLAPASPEAIYNLAYFLEMTGRVDEAIAGYRKVLLIDPRLATAHNNLGNALRAKGLVDEALGHYAEAARLAPGLLQAAS